MELINAYLSGGDLVLLSRDEAGKLQRKTTVPEWVTYLNSEDTDEDFARQLGKSRFVRSLKREGKWIRVGWTDRLIREEMLYGRRGSDPRPSPFEERSIRTYEGDVHPARRYLTDTGAAIARPRRAYFDIETDSRVPFSRKESARMLSWAIVGEDGRKWSRVLEADENAAERDLLWQLFEVIDQFDQVLAWNGDNFDFPVLKARVDQMSMRVEVDRWLWLDHLALFKRMNTASESGEEKQSLKLQSVAMALLGEGKDDFDGSKTWQAWEAGGAERERLVRYNVKDTELLLKIEAKTGSASLFDTIAQVTRVFPDNRGLNPTAQMDGYMLREGLERGVHFPTKRYREGLNEQYAGAYVMEPKAKGIEKDVHVADFASLYPSIILTWNMSPETKVDAPINGPIQPGTCRSPKTRQHFGVGAPGILPDALKRILGLRKEWNDKKASAPPGTPDWYDADRRSTAYKVVANSFYGVIGSPYSRFFDKRIAEAVTTNGQWLIQRTIEEAEKRGMVAIYADTDSLFVKDATRTQFEEFVRWCNAELYPKILAEQGCTENHVKLAYEKQFRRVVFVSAKRYAGVFAHYKGKEATKDSKPEIKGLEYKRGDAAILARRLQEKVINRLVVDGEERAEAFREILGGFLDRILNETLPVEEVSISKSVTKKLDDYGGKKKGDGSAAAVPVHVRVAKMLEERGAEVGEGTRVAYVVLDGDGGINAAIPAEDYDGNFDRYYLWENLVYPPTQRFLQAAFPDVDWATALEKVRPPKPKGKRGKVADGQLGLMIGGEKKGTFVLPVVEGTSEEAMKELRAAAARHPGGMDLVIHVCLESGAVAVLNAKVKVSGSPAFHADVERVMFEARHRESYWREACAS